MWRRCAVAPPGFLNRDWRSGFADSNPLWLDRLPLIQARPGFDQLPTPDSKLRIPRREVGKNLLHLAPVEEGIDFQLQQGLEVRLRGLQSFMVR